MSDAVTRLNAALEGRYEIERELGEGGMATVYLAKDLKHNRNVALKVLKPELAAVVGAERFLAEIETTANLQHPHILPLFDSGEADSFLFYVMPFVEGETLRERIDREKQLPVDEAVAITTAVANALQHAHDRGVIHRDIKPGNILLQDGQPVVADFGIALAVGAAGGARLTETGLSVGTPYYMSPEQATGDQGVGPSSDTYALAAVLYELLTGEPPYTGTTAQAVLGRIIQGAPVSATEIRKAVPVNVDAAIRKALERIPADRFTGAQDFAKALDDPGFRHGEDVATSVPRGRSVWRAGALLGVGGLIAVGAIALWGGTEVASGDLIRFTITPTEDVRLGFGGNRNDLAISRDGRRVVYSGPAPTGVAPQLNLRAIDQFSAAPIRGGEGGVGPFFSPDGEWVGFVHYQGTDVLQKVSTLGGTPVTLTEAPSNILGASWGEDDQIIFGTQGHGLFRVSGGGGEPVRLTTLDDDRGERAHVWPFIIPGSNAVLLVVREGIRTTANVGQLAVLRLDTNEVTRLDINGTSPRFVSTGHLLYAVEDGSVRAVSFNARSLQVTGSPVPLVEGVFVKASGAADFSVSEGGRLVYALGAAGGGNAPSNLVLVARDGTGSQLAQLQGVAWFPRFSPDGSRVAYALGPSFTTGGVADLWVRDLSRGAETRVTFGGDARYYPVWTPDGTRLTHADSPLDPNRVISTLADGSGVSDELLGADGRRFPTSWSPDGRTLAFYLGPAGTPTDSRDVWLLPMDGDTASPVPFVETPFMERGAIFSPDGRWVVYVSDKSGQNDVYARPFPGPGAEITISVGGGQEPVWAPSGDALYYRHDDELVMVQVDPTSPSLSVGIPSRVFGDRYVRDVLGSQGGVANYDISPDGEQFLMVEDPASSENSAADSPNLQVVLNWFVEVRARMGGN